LSLSTPQRPPRSSLFPYTTLFRSAGVAHLRGPRLLNAHAKLSAADLNAALASQARALGFDCVGVAAPDAIVEAAGHFRAFLDTGDRKSTRLNSSHRTISYAVFCLK